MKKKSLNKSLNLNKTTIAALSNDKQRKVKGGSDLWGCGSTVYKSDATGSCACL